jgi:hypothetical protein
MRVRRTTAAGVPRITVQKVWISGGGKVTLEGLDSAHCVGIQFDEFPLK